tara:strand:+ start:2371 stop:2592 length:222 start_codon:yes stop_codon:yes gene_type:complete
MNKNLTKELKDIIWNEGLIDPTDILVRFYELKGMKLSREDKLIFTYWKPETILRESRNLGKPSVTPKQTSLLD